MLHGCHRYRETATSKLDANVRRNLCPIPGDIRFGVSYQIAFRMIPKPQSPFFVQWADGQAARIADRQFDHIQVLGPLDHCRFFLEAKDWEACLPAYRLFLDV